MPNLIRKAISTKVDLKQLNAYVHQIENQSFDFDLIRYSLEEANYFRYGGNNSDKEITSDQMLSFFNNFEEILNNLTNESTYERPWCLGGPVERMDKNVATAKAAVFKSMLSTAVTSPTKEESVNNDNAEGKKEENIITHDVEELEGNESNESNESKNNKK